MSVLPILNNGDSKLSTTIQIVSDAFHVIWKIWSRIKGISELISVGLLLEEIY
jgi:hypothetical protein